MRILKLWGLINKMFQTKATDTPLCAIKNTSFFFIFLLQRTNSLPRCFDIDYICISPYCGFVDDTDATKFWEKRERNKLELFIYVNRGNFFCVSEKENFKQRIIVSSYFEWCVIKGWIIYRILIFFNFFYWIFYWRDRMDSKHEIDAMKLGEWQSINNFPIGWNSDFLRRISGKNSTQHTFINRGCQYRWLVESRNQRNFTIFFFNIESNFRYWFFV